MNFKKNILSKYKDEVSINDELCSEDDVDSMKNDLYPIKYSISSQINGVNPSLKEDYSSKEIIRLKDEESWQKFKPQNKSLPLDLTRRISLSDELNSRPNSHKVSWEQQKIPLNKEYQPSLPHLDYSGINYNHHYSGKHSTNLPETAIIPLSASMGLSKPPINYPPSPPPTNSVSSLSLNLPESPVPSPISSSEYSSICQSPPSSLASSSVYSASAGVTTAAAAAAIPSSSKKLKTKMKKKAPKVKIPVPRKARADLIPSDCPFNKDQIVYTHIDVFNGLIDSLGVDDAKKLEFKDMRRRGKNRDAAKNTRENQIKHMNNLKQNYHSINMELSEINERNRNLKNEIGNNVTAKIRALYSFHQNLNRKLLITNQ